MQETPGSGATRGHLEPFGSRLFGRQEHTETQAKTADTTSPENLNKAPPLGSNDDFKSSDDQPSLNPDIVHDGKLSGKTDAVRRASSKRRKSASSTARVNRIRRKKSRDPQLKVELATKDAKIVRKVPDVTGQNRAGVAMKISPFTKKRRWARLKTSVSANKSLIEALASTVDEQADEAVDTATARNHYLRPVETRKAPVPGLAYDLARVLFNPGVYHLQDPRSRVYNFDPYLEELMPAAEFNFDALKKFITSSEDVILRDIGANVDTKYAGSSSSMTATLAHFHYLLSQWRPLNFSNQSQAFPITSRKPTIIERAPAAIFLKWRDGKYAIDADKQFSDGNILMMLGQSMEKLLTLETAQYEKYRLSNPEQISDEEQATPESFHYTIAGKFVMRSQLDAYDSRLPGTGMFDLKTRAVVSVRMDAKNYTQGRDYEIRTRHGEWESFEREYYDMIRSAFLKYSLQVRMGRMDGIFVAFHNTQRIFGFQYISLPEMDLALHGQHNTELGNREFCLSLEILERVLDRATARYPNTVNLHTLEDKYNYANIYSVTAFTF